MTHHKFTTMIQLTLTLTPAVKVNIKILFLNSSPRSLLLVSLLQISNKNSFCKNWTLQNLSPPKILWNYCLNLTTTLIFWCSFQNLSFKMMRTGLSNQKLTTWSAYWPSVFPSLMKWWPRGRNTCAIFAQIDKGVWPMFARKGRWSLESQRTLRDAWMRGKDGISVTSAGVNWSRLAQIFEYFNSY